MTDPELVLSAIGVSLADALHGDLLGLYAHGSWVTGDFADDRSDLDVLAVLSREPDAALLSILAEAHLRIEELYPVWKGRIEVEYIDVATVAAIAAAGNDATERLMVRISPGEDIHLLPATSHRLLTWATVRSGGLPLLGPPPTELLPPIDPARVRSAALDHVRDWPSWVLQMRHPGGQAYAVLTLCRALHLFVEGSQISKLQAARYAIAALPDRAGLIVWARDWWYAGGSDDEQSRHDEVTAFVQEVSARIRDL